MDISTINTLSFRDSLIISSALSTKYKFVLSEDLQHGQQIANIEIVSPLLI